MANLNPRNVIPDEQFCYAKPVCTSEVQRFDFVLCIYSASSNTSTEKKIKNLKKWPEVQIRARSL